jgi:transposase
MIGATILSAVLGNGSAFKNGRHFAAFLGLVPKQHSSGEREKLLGISKGGDTYLRTILIHGARSVLLRINKKNDSQSIWLRNLRIRCGHNKTAVALAHKIAKVAWAIAKWGTKYDPNCNSKFNKEPINQKEIKRGLAHYSAFEGALARPL